jgi:hypothetical protein
MQARLIRATVPHTALSQSDKITYTFVLLLSAPDE